MNLGNQLDVQIIECEGNFTPFHRMIFRCKCHYPIVIETWNKERCFGSGTVLKDNKLPRYCPNCGSEISSDGLEYNTTYCSNKDWVFTV